MERKSEKSKQDFRVSFFIEALKISKKHFATFNFFVRIKLVSTVWVSTSLSKSGYKPRPSRVGLL